jgi:hypothetical protein
MRMMEFQVGSKYVYVESFGVQGYFLLLLGMNSSRLLLPGTKSCIRNRIHEC